MRDNPETMLNTIARAAVDAARAGKAKDIQILLDNSSRALRRELAELIALKPNPTHWTADEHVLFLRATNSAPSLHQAGLANPRPPAATAFDRPMSDEIPF